MIVPISDERFNLHTLMKAEPLMRDDPGSLSDTHLQHIACYDQHAAERARVKRDEARATRDAASACQTAASTSSPQWFTACMEV